MNWEGKLLLTNVMEAEFALLGKETLFSDSMKLQVKTAFTLHCTNALVFAVMLPQLALYVLIERIKNETKSLQIKGKGNSSRRHKC